MSGLYMDFQNAARLGTYLAKDYAKDFFSLLVSYRDISASEAASRLGLHIRTAQDFLKAMAALNIVSKQEVFEKKRPYFRYTLLTDQLQFTLDLKQTRQEQGPEDMARKIRESSNAGANFSLARGGEFISQVSFWTGNGRNRKERKISLTRPQGTFLYHLPFPNTEALAITEILRKAGLDKEVIPEIMDIVNLLETHKVIEGF